MRPRSRAVHALLVAGALAASVAACKRNAHHPVCDELDALIGEAEALERELLDPLRVQLQEAFVTPPRTTDEPCPITSLPWSSSTVLSEAGLASAEVGNAGSLPHVAASLRDQVESCGERMAIPIADSIAVSRPVIEDARTEHILVLVELERVQPEIISSTTFEPGELRALALVYSAVEHDFVCAAEVSASSFETVLSAQTERAIDSLNRDLNRRATEASRTALRVIAR